MKKLTLEEFIEKAKKIHGDKYDYSKSIYNGNHHLLTIICPKHGDFQQSPANHYRYGCNKCADEYKRALFQLGENDFIEKARKIHGDKYNYSKVKYINYKTKVIIGCPEHGDFEQTPAGHLKLHGCPICKSSKCETVIGTLLKTNNIYYEVQKTWNWLKFKHTQYVDFYLPEYNIIIECQGIQHFKEFKLFNKEYSLKYIQDRDKNKLELCTQHGIKVLYYSNLGEDFEYPYEVFTDPQCLIDEIKKIGPTN